MEYTGKFGWVTHVTWLQRSFIAQITNKGRVQPIMNILSSFVVTLLQLSQTCMFFCSSQLTKNVLLTFPFSYENVIFEWFQTFREHSLLAVVLFPLFWLGKLSWLVDITVLRKVSSVLNSMMSYDAAWLFHSALNICVAGRRKQRVKTVCSCLCSQYIFNNRKVHWFTILFVKSFSLHFTRKRYSWHYRLLFKLGLSIDSNVYSRFN